jgi:hypothetical protein
MDDLQRRRETEDAATTEWRDPAKEKGSASNRPATKSIWDTILFILHQILEFATTATLLAYGFIVPELRDTITSFGMGKTFVPERDIGSLEGKVILVTGGKLSHLIPPTSSY